MKPQVTELPPASLGADMDKAFEWVVWALVSFCLMLFATMVGAILWGYLQFSG